MSLRSSIMYLENALAAIENIKTNELNYYSRINAHFKKADQQSPV